MTASETLARTMRAAVMYAVDDIRIEERPLPALEPGDALVRMAACGVCGSDMMPWYVKKKAPFVFGHEPAGTVVAFGGEGAPADAPFALGDRIFAHHHVPCMACDACAAGRYVHCATWRESALAPGGMAEYVRVRRSAFSDAFALPASLSFVDASLIEPLACVVKSLRRTFAEELRATGVVPLDPAARPLEGRSLFVAGAGATGLMHVALAARLGALVFVSDYNVARLDVASRLGAAMLVDPDRAYEDVRSMTGGKMADAAICGLGYPKVMERVLDTVRADGTVLLFTPIDPSERFAYDQSPAYFRDLRLVNSYSCGPLDTRESLRAIERGIVTAAKLEVTTFAFPAVAEAFGAMSGGAVVKAVVTFESAGTR